MVKTPIVGIDDGEFSSYSDSDWAGSYTAPKSASEEAFCKKGVVWSSTDHRPRQRSQCRHLRLIRTQPRGPVVKRRV